jgi:hypothetical protein
MCRVEVLIIVNKGAICTIQHAKEKRNQVRAIKSELREGSRDALFTFSRLVNVRTIFRAKANA